MNGSHKCSYPLELIVQAGRTDKKRMQLTIANVIRKTAYVHRRMEKMHCMTSNNIVLIDD